MAGAASAHQAATASREQTSQQRTGRTRRTSADPQRAQQGATAAAADAPAALQALSRLQQLANASPQVAQLRRLQALADNRFAPVAQLAGGPEEEELVQGKFASAELQPQPKQAPHVNNTGLPDQLKSGIESLSGLSMDHVRVHYNSSQPAQLNALAYAQGSDIHLAPGQERHLPHEAWHVVQQAQGRVRPTMQKKEGMPVNDDRCLEVEAEVMGTRALTTGARQGQVRGEQGRASGWATGRQTIQCFLGPYLRQTQEALSEANENTTDVAKLKQLADILSLQICEKVHLTLTPMAKSITSPSESKAKPQGMKLLDQICKDLKVSRNGWADIQGYTRELSLAFLYTSQARLLHTQDSKEPAAKADAFWQNSGGPAAAQMKTILDFSKISANENLPKAIKQINGEYGENPPSGAARVADIGVTNAIDSNSLNLIDKQVGEVVRVDEKARVDAIRIWVTVLNKDKPDERVGMLRQFDKDGHLTHEQEYPLPDFDPNGSSPVVADFVLRGAPHELPIPYPESYPPTKKAGAVAKLGSLAEDAKLLFGLAESLQKQVPVVLSSAATKKTEGTDPETDYEEGFINIFD